MKQLATTITLKAHQVKFTPIPILFLDKQLKITKHRRKGRSMILHIVILINWLKQSEILGLIPFCLVQKLKMFIVSITFITLSIPHIDVR